MNYRNHRALYQLLTILLMFCSVQAEASGDGSGLSTAIATDLVGSFNLSDGRDSRDLFAIREAEISFYGPIDHLFEGVLSLAAHREKGEAIFEVHEASIASSKLISGWDFKLGQYFLGIGRLNRFHRHDWPFISAPKVFTEFFGSEGVFDSGGEISYLIPSSVYLNITAGITNGWNFGHSHTEGKKPKTPTHYARLSSFFEPYNLGISTGISYLSRTAYEGERLRLIGFDGVAKLQQVNFPELLLQGEAWHRETMPKIGKKNASAGGYLYLQYGFSRSFFTGCRVDYFTVLSLKDANGSKISNYEYGIFPTITYKSSEFMTFRMTYSRETSTQKHRETINKNFVELQSTFILGAHPSHDF